MKKLIIIISFCVCSWLPSAIPAVASNNFNTIWTPGITNLMVVASQETTNSSSVVFGAINANIKNDMLNVNWSTLSETSSNYFDVELSKGGEIFTPIGNVKSQSENGDSYDTIDYNFSVERTVTGTMLGLSFMALIVPLASLAKKWKTRIAILLIGIFAMIGIASCEKESRDIVYTTPLENHLYIRIRHVDKSGNSSYSRPVVVTPNF